MVFEIDEDCVTLEAAFGDNELKLEIAFGINENTRTSFFPCGDLLKRRAWHVVGGLIGWEKVPATFAPGSAIAQINRPRLVRCAPSESGTLVS